MKRKIILFIAILSTIMVIQTFARGENMEKAEKNFKIGIITDPHIIAKELGSEGEAFEEYLANDRKLLFYSEEIALKSAELLSESDCDIVIVCGDLTKDGELLSHQKFASILRSIEKSGKKVYVTPGNHDINNPKATRFIDNRTAPTEMVNPYEFRKIYEEFGFSEAISTDRDSLSYVVEPVEWLRIISMDSCDYDENIEKNSPETSGRFKHSTINWIEEQIKQGREKGQIVIGMMHHGIVEHFSVQDLIFSEYIVKGWEILSDNFADLGMHMVFTGHFHAQDITKRISENGNSIYDVQTGSLVTYPVPYRIAEFDRNGNVEINSYLINNIDNYNKSIPFTQYAKDFLDSSVRSMINGSLKGILIKRGISKMVVDSLFKQIIEQKIIEDYTIMDMACNCIARYYAGDEVPDELTVKMVAKLKKSMNIIHQQIASVIMTVAEDLNTPDNELSINLYE